MPPATYEKIRTAAEKYVKLYEFDIGQGQRMDVSRLQALQTADFTQSWGHAYMVSQRPGLQGTLDQAQFLQHLGSMVPHLQLVRALVHDVLVDERRRTAIVQMSYFLTPRGASDASENDLVWLLEFDEQGEKVRRGKEYIDAAASARMGEIIKASRVPGSDDSFSRSTGQ